MTCIYISIEKFSISNTAYYVCTYMYMYIQYVHRCGVVIVVRIAEVKTMSLITLSLITFLQSCNIISASPSKHVHCTCDEKL